MSVNLREILRVHEDRVERYEVPQGICLLPWAEQKRYMDLVDKAVREENVRRQNLAEHWFYLAESLGLVVRDYNGRLSLEEAIEILIDDDGDEKILWTQAFPAHGHRIRKGYSAVTGRLLGFSDRSTLRVTSLSADLKTRLLNVAKGEFRKSIEEAEVL